MTTIILIKKRCNKPIQADDDRLLVETCSSVLMNTSIDDREE
jgi:hypothetical protein